MFLFEETEHLFIYYNSINRELQYLFIFSTFYAKIIIKRTVIKHGTMEKSKAIT